MSDPWKFKTDPTLHETVGHGPGVQILDRHDDALLGYARRVLAGNYVRMWQVYNADGSERCLVTQRWTAGNVLWHDRHEARA
jgi:hypothetical protein